MVEKVPLIAEIFCDGIDLKIGTNKNKAKQFSQYRQRRNKRLLQSEPKCPLISIQKS